jgi:hypothetical protein
MAGLTAASGWDTRALLQQAHLEGGLAQVVAVEVDAVAPGAGPTRSTAGTYGAAQPPWSVASMAARTDRHTAGWWR